MNQELESAVQELPAPSQAPLKPKRPLGPFLTDMGVEFVSAGEGLAEIALQLEERHMNGWHATHGGVTMTLLDVVMSMAGRTLDPAATGGVTVDMNTSFLAPAGKPGSRVVARGKAYHRTLTLCFCEGELWDGPKLVARSMGTFKYLKRPLDGRTPGKPGN